MAISNKMDSIFSESDLTYKTSRSGGPGGQNVNKLSTKVTVFFDINNCPTLSQYQKKVIFNKLKTRVDKNGIIRVTSQRHRTQKANRVAAVERLGELLQDALKTKPVRRKTSLPYRAKQKRLQGKKQRSEIKKQRSEKFFDTD